MISDPRVYEGSLTRVELRSPKQPTSLHDARAFFAISSESTSLYLKSRYGFLCRIILGQYVSAANNRLLEALCGQVVRPSVVRPSVLFRVTGYLCT